MDDENLSPFDMLPDSDLLSGQKGREHSPVSVQLSNITLKVSKIHLLSSSPIMDLEREPSDLCLNKHVYYRSVKTVEKCLSLSFCLSFILQLRRLLCLSRSPPEKDTHFSSGSFSTGKVALFTHK